MTKNELVQAIATAAGVTKSIAENVIAAQGDVIARTLKGGDEVHLPGIGKLRVKMNAATKARMGKNPRTGEPIEIAAQPARRVVKLKVAGTLNDAVA